MYKILTRCQTLHELRCPSHARRHIKIQEQIRSNKIKIYFSQIESWVNFLTLCFVGTYTILTYCALDTTQRHVEISRDTEIRQLRAYVIPSESSIIVTTPDILKVHLVFKNYGLTPAHKLSGWNCIAVGRYSKDKDGVRIENKLYAPQFDEKAAVSTTVAPQDTKNVLFPSFCDENGSQDRSITPEEVARVQSGRAAIYIYGEQSYFDVFGKRHFTKYRMVGIGNGGTFDATEGNDFD